MNNLIRTVEVYDSFRQHLLEVRFELPAVAPDVYSPVYVHTCRTSYGSLRPMMMKEEQLELDVKT